MKNIVILGAPGSGKSTLSEQIAKYYSIVHISTGKIFRMISEEDTELGRRIKTCLNTGNLISDTLTIETMKTCLKRSDLHKGYVLDGFPRTLEQTKWLVKEIRIAAFIILDIHFSTITERLSGRRVHLKSNRTYHIKYNPPKQKGYDDISNEPIIQREDDKPAMIQHRLAVYETTSVSMLDFVERYPRCIHINAEISIQDMVHSVIEKIHSHNEHIMNLLI